MKSQPHPLPSSSGKIARSGNREVVAERPGKVLYLSEKPEYYVQVFCGNGKAGDRRQTIPEQLAALRNEISSYLFEYLHGYHIPTHFVDKLSETEMLVHRTDPLPLIVRIYNFGTDGLSHRLGVPPGSLLEYPIIEHYYSNGLPEPSWVNEHHLYAMKIVTPDEFKHLTRAAAKTNVVLRSLCDRRQLMLSTLQLSFGRMKNQVMLIDELSPMTCHLVDAAAVNGNEGQESFAAEGEHAVEALTKLSTRLQLKRS